MSRPPDAAVRTGGSGAQDPMLRVLRGNPTEGELAALLVALAVLRAGADARQASTTGAAAAGRPARSAVRGLRTHLRPRPGARSGEAHRVGAVRMLSRRWPTG